MKFYLDTCIWLNLFKKEGDATKGKPYWKIAKEFIEKKFPEIFYSGFVLKEIKFVLKNDKLFKEKSKFMNNKFRFIKAIEMDRGTARKLEAESKYEISFYDCLHIAICKRLNLILVTRDNDLIKFARKYILINKPENLFS